MNEKNHKIAFIGGGTAHPAVKLLANQVCNTFYYIKPFGFLKNSTYKIISTYIKALYYCFKIPKYDYYLLSGPTGLFMAFLKKNLRREKGLFILRVNNDAFSPESKGIKRKINALFGKSIDRFIAVSEMIKQDIKEAIPTSKVKVYYSPLLDESYFELSPNFKEKNIVCIGTSERLRKGTDIQIKVHKLLNNNSKMYILGNTEYIKDLYEKNKNTDNLIFTGFTDPKRYLSKSLFLLHPARFDPGPNVILEAMAAGVIPIISYRTGRVEIVSKVDSSLIINSFNPEDYACKLNELLKMDEEELKCLSNKCKKVAKLYHKKYKPENFKEFFKTIIESEDYD